VAFPSRAEADVILFRTRRSPDSYLKTHENLLGRFASLVVLARLTSRGMV